MEAILEQTKYRRRYIEKISTDSDLAFWRADPAFDAWLQDYKNRKIVTTDDILKSSLKPAERRARDLNEKGLDAVVNYEYEKAIDFFQQAVQQDPKFVGACVNLASTRSVDVMEEAAIAALDQLERCAKMDLPFTQMRMKHSWEFQSIRGQKRFQDLLAKKH